MIYPANLERPQLAKLTEVESSLPIKMLAKFSHFDTELV